MDTAGEERPECRDDEIRTLEVLKETVRNTNESPLLVWYPHVVGVYTVVPGGLTNA
jgi:hypothetical protein